MDNIEIFFRNIKETFPMIDFSEHPIAASLFLLVLIFFLSNVAKWLMIALHHVGKDKDKDQ